jgi:hypothetical protein
LEPKHRARPDRCTTQVEVAEVRTELAGSGAVADPPSGIAPSEAISPGPLPTSLLPLAPSSPHIPSSQLPQHRTAPEVPNTAQVCPCAVDVEMSVTGSSVTLTANSTNRGNPALWVHDVVSVPH